MGLPEILEEQKRTNELLEQLLAHFKEVAKKGEEEKKVAMDLMQKGPIFEVLQRMGGVR